MIGSRMRIAAVAALAAVAAATAPAVAQTNIGVASATQNEVQGDRGGAARPIAPGSAIFQDETITTGARSMAQLMFLDETTLSMGPQSDVKLDRFVFDPNAGAGSVILSTTKGAFRFITGSQDPANYEIRTPFASIGVRGTIVDCYSQPIGLYCTAQEGTVVIVIGGVTYTLKPGEALFVAANGGVTGPFTPDGEFFRVAGIVPFPLYGAMLPGDHQETEVPDGSTNRLDELFEQCTGEGCGCDEYPYCY